MTKKLNPVPAKLFGEFDVDKSIRLFRENFGDLITPDLVKQYIRWMRVNQYSRNTLAHYKSALRVCVTRQLIDKGNFSECYHWEIVFGAIKTPRIKETVRASDLLSAEELAKLIANATPKERVLIESFLFCAPRVSELMSLKLSDCVIAKNSEGIPDRVIFTFRKTKNGRVRENYMPLDLFIRIRQAYTGKIYLFERYPGKHIHRNTASKLVSRAGRRILNRRVYPHLFRHIWVEMVRSEFPEFTLQDRAEWLGHLPITQEAVYAHANPQNSEFPYEFYKKFYSDFFRRAA